jgi:hypothetical protein
VTNGDPNLEFTWWAHPARERTGAAVAGGAVIVAFAVLAGVLMSNPWWAVFAAGIFLVCLNRFYLPSRFSIDEEGITARYPLSHRRLRWADLRRFALGEHGAFLSTRAAASRMDTSGVQVLFGGDRESVVARIRSHLPDRGADGSGGGA